MAILNHGSTIRTADGGQSTTAIVTASNIGTYGIAANSTYYIGTTQNVFNRASGAQTLTGVSIDGNAANITAYTINQNVGSSNSPTFATLQLTRLNFGATGTTPYAAASGEGIGNGITFGGDEAGNGYRIFTAIENIGGNYSKLTFNWHTGIRIGAAYQYGGTRFYNNSVGVGTEIFSVGNLDNNVRVINTIYAQSFYDINNTSYYLDAANSGTSLLVAGNVGIGNTSPSAKLHVSGASYTTASAANNNVRFEGGGGNGLGFGTIDATSTYASWIQSGYVPNFATATYALLLNPLGGNVGIGTTSPLTKLDIANTQASGITMRFDTSTSYQAWIRPYWNSTTDSRVDFAINRAGGSTPDVIMSVGYGSNVGIGTTSPSQKLHVVGTGFASSDFRAPIFYDSDNTAYYVDAASTSVLNALTVGGNNVLTTASTLTAGNLSGTIPSGVLGNSTLYVGTTAIALNRGSASQSLTGVNIDGSSGSCTGNAATATNSTQLGGVVAANYANKYSTTINNLTTTFQTVCNVVGNGLASCIRASFTGTGNGVVINVVADILVNHFQDILITSLAGFYSILTIRIVSDNNENFTLQIKQDTDNVAPIYVEIFPLNSETITFSPPTIYTTNAFNHICQYGTTTTGNGGNSGDIRTAGSFIGALTGNVTGNVSGSSASCTGNAATATILQTARNINGTSFNGSAAITTATWGTARTLTIGSTGKSVDGSAGVSWSLAEIGALPLSGGQITGNTTFSADNHLTFGPNSTWGSSIRIGGNGYTATGTEMASVVTTDGNLHLDAAKSTNGIYLNWYGGTSGVFFGNGSSGQVAFVSNTGNASFSGVVDATQFRDASNTAYYLDPNSLSNIRHTIFDIGSNVVGATGIGVLFDGNYTSGQYRHRFRKYDDGNGLPLYVDYAHATANSFTAIARFGGGGSYNPFSVYGTADASGDFRAPIFYDSNDTTYYIDPANGGFNLRGGNSNRVTFNSGDSGIIVTNAEGVSSNVRLGCAWGRPGIYNGSSITVGAETQIDFVIANAVKAYIDSSSNLFSNGSVRSPIFYDSNNTAFYIDAASTSVLNRLTIDGGNYANNYFQSLSDFVNGTLVTTDIPATATNGLSFVMNVVGKSYNTTTSPFNFSVQGYLYDNTIINFSGLRLDSSGLSTIKIFENGGFLCFWWARVSYWNAFEVSVRSYDAAKTNYNRVTNITDVVEPTGTKKVTVTLQSFLRADVSATNAVDLRAPIFYDSNDTTYYTDPSSLSNILELKTNKNWYDSSASAWGGGINMGGNNPSIGFQSTASTWWYMLHHSSSNINFYRRSTSGSWNHDGIWDSSGNFIWQGSSVRAPIFYDQNNTAFYCDPTGTSNFTGLTVANTITGSVSGNAATATNVTWTGITQSTRTNYDLTFQPPTSGYAGFSFNTTGGVAGSGGYFLIRGTSDNDVYTAEGITLVADAGWLTLAQRTTASRGVRIMTGTSSSERLKITTAGDIQFVNGNSFTYNSNVVLHAGNYGGYSAFSGSVSSGGNITATGYIFTSTYLQTGGNLIYPSGYGATQRLEVSNSANNTWITGISIAPGGIVTAPYEMRSPIFYDSNDTGYYCDPASTSRLNTLSVGTGAILINGAAIATDRNLKIKGATSTGVGIVLYDGSDNFRCQIYGETSNYGFLDSLWGGWDIKKTIGGNLNLNNNTTYYLNPASTTNLNNLTVAGTMTFGTLAYVTESRRSKNSSNVDIETVTGLVSPSGPTFLEIRGFCPPAMFRTTGDRPAPYGLGFGNGAESGGIMPIGAGDNLQEIMLYGSNTGPTTFTFKRQNWEGSTYDPSYSNNYSASVFSINTGTGVVTASTDIRAPIFYDSNDTAYYLDPRSASVLSGLKLNGIDNDAAGNTSDAILWINKPNNNDWGIRVTGNLEYLLKLEGATSHTYNIQGLANGSEFWRCGTDLLYHNSNIRAPIFYDSNNTAYYLDPNSTTSLRTVGSWRSDSSTWDGEFAGKIQYHSNNWYLQAAGSWLFRTSGGTNIAEIDNAGNINGVGGFLSGNLQIRNTVPTITFRDTDHRTGYIHVNANIFHILTGPTDSAYGGWSQVANSRWPLEINLSNNNATFGGDVNAISLTAPIFYDANNTAYYCDPASTSNLVGLTVANTITGSISGTSSNVTISNLNTQQVSISLAAGAWYTIAANDANRASAKFTITDTSSGLHQAIHFYATAHYGTDSGAKISVISNTYYGGPPVSAIKIMRGSTYDGAMVQIYALSACNLTVSIYDNQQSSGWVIKSGVVSTTNPGTVANYAALTTVAAAVDLSAAKSFSISDEIYIGGATTQYKALHANNYNSYAPTLTGTGASGSWGISVTGSSASCTGNAATTTLATKATRANGNFYIDDNYGNTVVGAYSASRYQGVYAMGDSYKLAADGSTTGSLYGIAWSHPNAGGAAGNLSDHGALILLNGGYAAAISSSIRCTADMRTPIYYDSNDTAFYIDPASTSNFNTWTTATSTRIGRSIYWTNRLAKNAGTNYHTGTNGWGLDEGTWANAWKGGFSGWDIWGSNSGHPQGSGYVHAQGIVSGLHASNSDGTSAYGWMMVGSHNATDNRYWLRGKWDTAISGWVEMLTSGNYNSFSPTLTGTGANGSWGISVTGSSASCTGNSATATTATSSGSINSDTGNVGENRLQYWQVSGNTTLNPDTEWYNAIRMGHGNPVTYYSNTLAVKMTGSNLGDIYTRTTTNGTAGTWNRFWNNNNDGAGSGLDADLLDGINSASFLRSDASATNSVDLRSPIFYDSNNTAYYIDAASTSNLAGLTVANTITGSISGSSGSCTGNAANVTGTVAIANGGTGATTAAAARANLGITTAETSSNQSLSGSTTCTIDVAAASVHILSLANATTISSFTYNNRSASPLVNTLLVVLKFAGTATVTWSNVVWSNGTTPTLTGVNGKADVYSLTSYKGGTTGPAWIGSVVGQNIDSTNL